MKNISTLTSLLMALMLLGSSGFAQPTAEVAATDSAALENYLNSLEEMSDDEAAEAMSALIQVIETSPGMSQADVDAMVAGVVDRALTRIPLQRQPSFAVALINKSNIRAKVVVVSTIALTRQSVLENPELKDTIDANESLQEAVANTSGALGDSFTPVLEILRSQGAITPARPGTEGEQDQAGEQTGDPTDDGVSDEGDEPPAVVGERNEPPPPPGQPPPPPIPTGGAGSGGGTIPPAGPQPAPYDGQA